MIIKVTFKFCKVIINISLNATRILLKWEFKAFTIVSGSATSTPLNLMVVLVELHFFTKNEVDIRPYFLSVPNGTLLAAYDSIAHV